MLKKALKISTVSNLTENGKPNDNEVYNVDGSFQDYGYRNYDPRLGRFISVDPLTSIYPELTPYQFASNRPIDGVDRDGLEWTQETDADGNITYRVKVKVLNSSAIMKDDEVKKATEDIINYSAFVYSGKVDGKDVGFILVPEYVDEEDVDKENDFFIEFTDEIEDKNGMAMDDGTVGKVNTIGDTQKNRIQILSTLSESEMAETGTHELGHTGGLRHEKGDRRNPLNVLKSMLKNNIMNRKNFGNEEITEEQLKEFDRFVPQEKKSVIP